MAKEHDTSYTNQTFNLVGTRPARPDGIEKVTGSAKYGADAFAPGQLVGRVLRSPHAHARGCDACRLGSMNSPYLSVFETLPYLTTT